MPEYVANAIQTVNVGENVRFTDTVIPCKKGYVIHRDGSGLFTLRGIVNNTCGCSAQYKVSFGSNIAVPPGGTAPAQISLAVAINGEVVESTRAAVTPATADQFWNVGGSVYITVPRGCCMTISIENSSAAPINVANTNLIIERTA